MELEILKSMYKINSKSGQEDELKMYLYEILSTEPFKSTCVVQEDKKGNMYITKGVYSKYPCFVAHLDEVHTPLKHGFDVIEHKGILFGFSERTKHSTGIGADDKNGIFVCLNMLEKLAYCKVAWFVEEETGCQGSSKADMDFFTDCLWVVQPDRKGAGDLITKISYRDICSTKFRKDVMKIAKNYGYKPENGMMTDVETLVDNGIGISCVNMSCGYYYPHSDNECTDIDELSNCINFCWDIAITLTERYPHVPEKKKSYYNYYDDYVWNNLTKSWDYKDYRKEEYNGGKLVTRAGRQFRMYGTKGNPWYQEISTKRWYTEIEMPKEPVVQRPSKPDFDAIPCNSCRNNFDCMNCDWYNTENRID
jgi:putative aminopeptidase FrvX